MATAVVTQVANWLGFKKRYNLWLFIVLNGALFAFVVSRLSYFDFYGIFCRPAGAVDSANNAAPGECFYLLKNPYTVGIILHLATVLPAAFLACFQFLPVIRYRLMSLHRANGYIIIVFSVLSVIGAFMITRRTFGGGLDVQAAIGVLATLFLFSTFMAYYNIKKLQIEEHRAWMLRAWVYVRKAPSPPFSCCRERKKNPADPWLPRRAPSSRRASYSLPVSQPSQDSAASTWQCPATRSSG